MVQTLWKGYPLERDTFEGHTSVIVSPKEGTANGLLAIKTDYWSAFPKAIELPLLEAGFHLCYLENGNRWGTEDNIDRQADFIRFVTERRHLQPGAVPVGMSCGGMIAILLAAKYPELVRCMYLDAPVLNFLSCPCGLGQGIALNQGDATKELLDALGMDSVSQLLSYRKMPMDYLPQLVSHRIPAVLVAGDADEIAPFPENGALLQAAYEEAGIPLMVRIKPGANHHPHGLKDPSEVFAFLMEHCGLTK